MANIGHSFGILSGRVTGDKERAKGFLDSLSDYRYKMQNREESKAKGRLKRKVIKMGARPTIRKTV